jgi:hypothetical protein
MSAIVRVLLSQILGWNPNDIQELQNQLKILIVIRIFEIILL